ncbi:hypothetical protein VKT23_020732 [Stygiomarasmius scandens]|uniref:Chitin synthase n=1 Tax=Marasmiellus scandens TaxID=2682957 RepID=A0ABR1IIF3_9AGAR
MSQPESEISSVNPTYLVTVDADPYSVNQLMVCDKKLLGVCGETVGECQAVDYQDDAVQLYQYFISHHMAKAFESLFGSITCLPGCFSMFSMYRFCTPETHRPLFISNQIIRDYSENRVDTLHMKRLLHLGEDRYLTTLLLEQSSNAFPPSEPHSFETPTLLLRMIGKSCFPNVVVAVVPR